MKEIVKAGATSKILQVFIRDSSSTTGGGLTGLVFNSASLTAYYHRDTDTTATAMTLVTMTVGTFTSLGFKEIDATNMPGWYQFCPPNAAIAASAKSVAFHLKGAANMVPLTIELQLTLLDLQTIIENQVWDATMSSHVTALTTGASLNAAGSAGDPWSTALPGGYGAGTAGKIVGDNVNATISSRSTYAGGDTAGTTTLLSRIASAITITSNKVDINDKTGFSLSGAGIQAIWDALTSALTTVGSIGKRLADDIDAAISSRSTFAGGAVSSVTGNVGGNVVGSVGSVTAGVTVTTNNDKTGYGISAAAVTAIWAALTSALTTVGSIGKLIVDNLNATISSRSVYAGGAVASVTGNVGGNVNGNVNGSVASCGVVTSITNPVTVGTNNDKGGYTVSVVSDKTGYSLSSGAIDAILDDTPSSELSSVPSSTDTFRKMMQFCFEYLKNKRTVTAGTETLFKDDSATSFGTASVSDDGTTFTKGKMA